MSDAERDFYNELNVYLMDGFALAKQQGNKGRALGFVMTIFQKIAASSFAAVHHTLLQRLIALTVQEGLMHDAHLDIDARDAAFIEARALIQREFHLGDDRLAAVDAERILADMKRRLLKKMSDEELAVLSSEYSSETTTTQSEDVAITAVALCLPEERKRIRELLQRFPRQIETKTQKLIHALETLWRQDSKERVVVFATYLGTVEMLGQEIDKAYPGQGVVVLKGGDHSTKLAAEKRFKRSNGPRVLICTAAGREGINLQHARVLFNFDLPWNPMDIEQRIGRIHRYGQRHTAQVYNLVLSDTIEGRIFLLLDDKLKEIAKTLGNVDERGEVAEDLRTQILGQLSERLSYESLYATALNDPELKRTRLELEAALSNAAEARNVVFELFQDLDGFSLEDYQPFSDTSEGMSEIVRFVRTAVEEDGQQLNEVESDVLAVTADGNGVPDVRFTTEREESLRREDVELIGLDHPLVVSYMNRYRNLPPEELGIRVQSDDGRTGVLSIWHVTTQGERGETQTTLLPLAIDNNGQRIPPWERHADRMFQLQPAAGNRRTNTQNLLSDTLEPMILRELSHRGFIRRHRGYDAKLIGWVEIV